ncbi:MAG: hypothetical protein VX527_01920 [Planctomycetota bacterium]|nr:hypothetical protein [Planctomycetota bacterium]
MSIISPNWNLLRHGISFLMATVLVTGVAWGQQTSDPATNLKDFIHYALVANAKMAEAHAQALLNNVTDEQLAELADDADQVQRDRLKRAIDWARRVPELEATVSQLAQRIEAGRLALGRNPQRIKDAIAMLDGTRREQLVARGRLVAAGEYAVPDLVEVIIDDRTDERVRWNAEQILTEIGREAVTPITVSMPNLPPEDQKRLILILDEIRYLHAAPALAEIASDPTAPSEVRDAAQRALDSLGVSPQASPGELYSELAGMYFEEREELIARSMGSVNNIWYWDEHGGLMTNPVPTRLYAPIMAMKSAQSAMKFEPSDQSALAIYVASNLRRENRLKGQEDPYFGTPDYSPQFHATFYGPGIGQDVLVLGLDSGDTPLVRDALVGLASTSGQDNLFGRYAGREPLVDALQYPDRRVQYESALVLARALPDRSFPASNRVIPLLASAVRTGGEEYAIIVADTVEDRQAMQSRLEALGFTVVGADRSVARLSDVISQAPGVDLAVVMPITMTGGEQTLKSLRTTAGTINTPVLFSIPTGDLPAYHTRFDRDRKVGLIRSGATEQAFDSGVESLLEDASGGRMTGADSDIYAIESLDALKSLAMVRPRAYSITDAEPTLIDALDERQDATRLMVAEILAHMDSPGAQRALLDAALSSSSGSDQIPLLNYAAASIRRYGDYATDTEVAELNQMIKTSKGAEADAAANVRGALNRPTTGTSPLTAGQGS